MSHRERVSSARRLAVAGLIAAAVALVVLPPVFGLIGVVLGVVSWRRGESLGGIAAVVAVVATGTGLALSALVAR